MENTRKAFSEYRNGGCDLETLWSIVAKDITQNIGSTRASVWIFNATQDEIHCKSLYDTRDDQNHTGAVLKEEDFGPYFKTMRDEGVIVASDAITHPATKCFDELYFVPNDIMSLLDVVIYDGSEQVGVLCCEHCEERKNWSDGDIKYLEGMAAVLRLAFRDSNAQAALAV